MDPRLLEYYDRELRHLREMGREFALEHPKIAARLGINDLEVSDPYVERLLEGVGFLAARVQLKLDAEFPRFTQALLEIVYPHYLAPTPSMVVAQLKPELGDPNLATGFRVPRGTTMHGRPADNDVTVCQFRTAHDVTLWPIEIVSASYFSFAPDLPLHTLPIADRIKGGLRIRLKTTAGLRFSRTSLDRLPFYLTGHDEVANNLHQLCLGSCLGVFARAPKSTGWHEWLPAATVKPVGFADDEALLPVTLQSYHGYRLLQEYFAFPARYRFFELTGLSKVASRADTDEIELVLLFGQGTPALERVVEASSLVLFCTPAINLFQKRADRIHVSDAEFEFHVVPERTQPQDFEVYQVTSILGFGEDVEQEQLFLPFYTAYSRDRPAELTAYFTTRREPRLMSSGQKRRGTRSSYVGTEVFVSLVDAAEAPYRGDLRQLSVQTLCTNRDLVLRMPVGTGTTDLSLEIGGPVASIRVVAGPSRPFAPLADGKVSWQAISHLSLNYFSLVNAPGTQSAAALRELLGLYASRMDVADARQIEGVRGVGVKPVVRRLPTPGPIAFGRGLEIAVTVDERAFAGGSAFLLGAVLDRYFARHVSLNSFTETVLRSDSRGEINRWEPQWGSRPTL